MHDSCDSVSTNTQTTRYESDANTRTAVGLATSLKDSGDLDGETLISRFSCAWHTAEPCVISAARNTKRTAERRDWKAVAFTMDEHEPHRFLLAKNSVAFFRISKSMSTRLCSRRKRVSSSRSSVVSAPAGPSPASILARRTHSRSAASPMLRSLAMRRDRAIPDLAEPNSLCFELGREGTTWALGPFRCFVHDTLLASILANLGVHEIGGSSVSVLSFKFLQTLHRIAVRRSVLGSPSLQGRQ